MDWHTIRNRYDDSVVASVNSQLQVENERVAVSVVPGA